MNEELIEMIINWLEINGYEGFIDEENKTISYFDDSDRLVLFSKLNNKSLNLTIEKYGVDQIQRIA